MKKTLAALALAGSIALIGSAPAMATTYPAPAPGATVSDATLVPGQEFTFSGGGMLANESVTVSVELVAGPQALGANPAGSLSVASKINVALAPQTFSTTANAQGTFSLPITITEAGTYAISARGNVSGNTVGPVTVKVAAALASGAGTSNGGGAALANTGADSGLLLWTLVGAGALAAGAASVVVVRRRAKTEAAA